MAYDEILAERTRAYLADNPEIVEKKVFGGVAFMLRGNMAVGVSNDELMVRVGKEHHDEAISQSGVRMFDMSGRPMRGWLLVSPDVLKSHEGLARWIDTGLDYAGSLPPK